MIIKDYKLYCELNEGVKSWIFLILLLFNIFSLKAKSTSDETPPKVGVERIDKKNYIRTIKKTFNVSDTESESEFLKKMLRLGWKKTYTEIDTLYKNVIKYGKDTTTYTLSLKFDKNVLFDSGKFEINKTATDTINNSLNQIVEQNGILSNIEIVSSTDKMPIGDRLQKVLIDMGLTPDNEGLSKARSNSILIYLKNLNINKDLINVTNLFEQGGYDDQSSRYVYVNISFFVINTNIKDIENIDKEIDKVVTTHYFSKKFKDNKKKVDIKLPNMNFKVFKGNNKSPKCTKCPTWN